jgi:hypothetical protein
VIRFLRFVGLAKNIIDVSSMEEKKREHAERRVA